MFVPLMLSPRLRFFPALKSIMMMIRRMLLMWMIGKVMRVGMMMIKILACNTG